MSVASKKFKLPDDYNYRLHMLQGEIAVLLHDIGKYIREFAGEEAEKHGHDLIRTLRIEELRNILRQEIMAAWPPVLAGAKKLKTLADLACWRHTAGENERKDFFGATRDAELPMELFLLMCANSLDSTYKKDGVEFGEERLSPDQALPQKQDADFYLVTPFGGREFPLDLAEGQEKSRQFQLALAKMLENFGATCREYGKLRELRNNLLGFLEEHFAKSPAETRIPNNDVSLWQHSYATASIFKAMLAGHLLTGDGEYCDENGEPALHKEKLAILGLCWNEDQLLSRSLRPAEILGRRLRLDNAVEKLKDRLENYFCLGNEIYRDRNGIYFLIPALSRDNDGQIEKKLNDFTGEIDWLLNSASAEAFGGELAWQARYLDVGQRICRLTEMIADEGGEIRASGPIEPLWIADWQNQYDEGKEICPRCGCRSLQKPSMVGDGKGNATDTGMCRHCGKYLKDGNKFLGTLSSCEPQQIRQAKRLLAVDGSAEYLEFDLGKFFAQEDGGDEHRRLALIQGIVDLRPFLSGQAFSSILATPPGRHQNETGARDQDFELSTWFGMLATAETAWDSICQAESDNTKTTWWDQLATLPDDVAQPRHGLRRLFQDFRLGTMKDGRTVGTTGDEKALNLLRDIVLAAPFAPQLDGIPARLVNYALRQRPTPSRLARVCDTTEKFSRFPMLWCETKKVHYATISFDPGRFMLLLPAGKAWELCQTIQKEYSERFGRARHLLPLHLSATVFPWKTPLYIGVDAARRFAKLGLASSAVPEWWKVAKTASRTNAITLTLHDPLARETVWRIPTLLPDGRPDRHHGWYWKKGKADRPIWLDEVQKNDEIAIYPSSFDYEILDSASRRYDIRGDGRAGHGQRKPRPHLFKRQNGPRPYPLAVLESWQRIGPALAHTSISQRKSLIEILARLHDAWSGRANEAPEKWERYADARRGLAEDALKNTLGPSVWQEHGANLLAMACDGSLFDLVEWQDYINR